MHVMFTFTQMDGQPLKAGYNSHLSPDGMEVVIFDVAQILPCYVVHSVAIAAKTVSGYKVRL